MGASSFRLEHGSEAQGFGQRIVDDHGVIALVKARGKRVNAGPLLAVAPQMLEVLREAARQIEYLHEKFRATGSGECVLAQISAVVAKAEGK
jgi:hypothetical protein